MRFQRKAAEKDCWDLPNILKKHNDWQIRKLVKFLLRAFSYGLTSVYTVLYTYYSTVETSEVSNRYRMDLRIIIHCTTGTHTLYCKRIKKDNKGVSR
jgi:hypothetical protein